MSQNRAATITVDTANPSQEVSPHLFGVFFEEINYAGVGGLYPEKIQNRAFMDKRTPPSWPAAEVARTAGRFGNAIELNGQTRTAKVALPEGIAKDLTDFTVAAWIRPTNGEPFTKVFDFGSDLTGILFYNTSGQHMSLSLASPFYISPDAGPGPSYVISVDGKKEELHAPDPVPLGEWSHVAVTQTVGTARLYVNGVVVAMVQTSIRPRPVATETITSGNSRRMPNTATRMPTVRNSFCQNSFQWRSTEALTTALSNDSDTSITPSTPVIHSACSMPLVPPWV